MKKNNGSQSRKRELRVQAAPHKFEIRKNADGSRSISGYAATFGDLSQDLGGFKEKIQPGAFAQSLKDNPDVLCLYAHDDRQLLGRVSSGTLQIGEDAKGLRFTCQLPDTSTARDLIALMERGDVSHMSFGFACVSDEWQQQPDGQIVRTLLQVVLYEVSVVGQPAYTSSSVDLRSMPAELRKGLNADDDDYDCDPEVDDDCADDDEERDCECSCEACEAGDCSECTNEDCDDDDCEACPMQDEYRADRLRLRRLHALRTS